MTATECHLSNLDLPINDANTCWWLSANLALFHKKRPELDTYFSASSAAPSAASAASAPSAASAAPANASASNFNTFQSNLKPDFEKIYNYYSSPSPSPSSSNWTASNILEFRTSSNMTLFNTNDFKVNSNTLQDPAEYLNQLYSYINLEFNSQAIANTTNLNLYDMHLHRLFYGITEKSNTSVDWKAFYEGTSSLILTFRDPSRENSTINILKEISIPVFTGDTGGILTDPTPENMNTFHQQLGSNITTNTYYLDAMIVYEAEHWVSYVKCDTNDSWYYYKAIKAGPMTVKWDSFESMMASNEILSSNVRIMFYSKKEKDKV